MALTDPFIGLLLTQVAVYFVLYKNRVRWKRMMGSIALGLIGISYILIDDSLVFYIVCLFSILIGALQLFDDVPALIPQR